MRHNSDKIDQIEGIQVDWDSNVDGSNAIILPEKKKSKTKGADKGSKQSKGKQPPSISKNKLKKLKKLQEEKEKKLLQIKSIELLEKHKMCDGAYLLLQSSGTMGQAETVKDKRRRAVQLSKAGLEVPENILPLKKKQKSSISSDDEIILSPESGQNCPQNASSLDNDSDLKMANCMEVIDCHHYPASHILLDTIRKTSEDLGVGSNAVIPSPEFTVKETDNCNANDEIVAPSISCRSDEGNNAESQDQHVSDSDVNNTKTAFGNKVQGHSSTPIVVHVSRPKEVELKRKDLPIIMMEQEIMEAINEHPIVILCGETGCGKTTQVPQFLYEAGFGSKSCNDRRGIIGVTQPRRVAVLATAKRVSFELGLRLGKEIGFQVRHDKRIGDGCAIKFMTDGILLREVQSDFLLKRYSVIILDEAHERSLNTDILVGMLSRVIQLRKKLYLEQQQQILSGVKIDAEKMITQLKLILMSATLRVEDFISNRKLFQEAPPIVEVPVRQFPVTIHFSKKTHEDYLGQAYKKVMLIHKRLPPGGILVFVTGQREVEVLCKKLRSASKKLIADNSKRDSGRKNTPNLDVGMKEISEAFEASGSSLDQQIDRFSSFEEDDDCPEMGSDSSYSESESDFEDDIEETPEKSEVVLDLLRDSTSLSSLKASFEALAGKPCDRNSKEDQSLPTNSKEEPAMSIPSATEGQQEPTPTGPLFVLPLYAMLPASSQLRVFEEVPEGERLVVVATNVAETSLTIPGIKYVVDTGKEKVKHYNFANGMENFEVQWISKASAAQRSGRAGRTGPGHCYRLYSSAAFSKDDLFPDFSCPEISKIPVDGVVLLMKSMGIDKVANFPFPTPPEAPALVQAEHCLKALEALDAQGKLTPIGRAMAQYPMSPRHSRMLLTVIQIMRNQQGYARANLVLGYAIATASALSFQNPFNMQFDSNHDSSDGLNQEEKEDLQVQQSKKRLKKAKAMAGEARAKFCNPSSDALTFAYALQLFELAENPFEFCQRHSLHLKTMEDMSKLRKQLLQLIFYQSKFSEDFRWDHGSVEEVECTWRARSSKHPLQINEEELLGQAICAGWADRVARRIRKVSESSDNDRKVRAVRYQSCALNDTIYLHRWSSLSRSAPEFVVYTELLETNRPYMHGATSVKSDWLVKYASSLCSFSAPLTDPKPYYEPILDEVLCWVSPVFGRHNWQLPLHSLPIRNETQRLSVFACALLEGCVLPCMKTAQKFLAMPPSNVLRPEALGQKRVGDLLNGLKIGSKRIDSRAALREAWNENPRKLCSEIKNWFQDRCHAQFEELWEQMHQEVVLEGHELFPKRAKEDRGKRGK